MPLVPLLVGRSPKGSNGPKDTLLVFGVGVADGALFPLRFGGKGGVSVMLFNGSGVGTWAGAGVGAGVGAGAGGGDAGAGTGSGLTPGYGVVYRSGVRSERSEGIKSRGSADGACRLGSLIAGPAGLVGNTINPFLVR